MLPELKKIMHVEDDEDIQIITRLALENFGGYTIKSCSSGNEALCDIENYQPELDGPRTMQMIRNKPGFENTPVIFMTAQIQAQENEIYNTYKGVLGTILKPFDPTKLAGEIRNLWSKYYGQ